MLPWFPELAARAASTEERDPTRALEVPFGMRAGIVTALAGVSDADDPSGTVRNVRRQPPSVLIRCLILARSNQLMPRLLHARPPGLCVCISSHFNAAVLCDKLTSIGLCSFTTWSALDVS